MPVKGIILNCFGAAVGSLFQPGEWVTYDGEEFWSLISEPDSGCPPFLLSVEVRLSSEEFKMLLMLHPNLQGHVVNRGSGARKGL